MSLLTATDIANRALQRVGAERIAAGLLATEDSKNASEIRACYDILRRSELRRNIWRFAIRTTALRALNDYSKLVTFGTWAVGTTYAINDVVTGSDGQVYSSRAASNLAHDPTTSLTYWTLYFGPLVASEYVTTWGATPTFALGDHTVGSDGSVYTSLAAGNINHNPVGDGNVHWSLATTVDADDETEETDDSFYAGEIVYIGNKVYLSLHSGNEDVPPSSKWRTLTTAPTVSLFNFIYPIGSGPSTNQSTRNVFRLPGGYLREAPQDPKAGSTAWLGAPSGLAYDDWNFEGDFLTSSCPTVILFRFAADVSDPALFDPMFVEGFGSRIALEICEPLTQSTTKLQAIASEYKQFMGDARMTNGIETGPTEPPTDDYIACRL